MPCVINMSCSVQVCCRSPQTTQQGMAKGMLPLWRTSAQVKTNGPFLVGHGFHKAAKSMQATGAIRARHHGLSKAQLVISKAKSINMPQLIQAQ